MYLSSVYGAKTIGNRMSLFGYNSVFTLEQ